MSFFREKLDTGIRCRKFDIQYRILYKNYVQKIPVKSPLNTGMKLLNTGNIHTGNY